MKNLLIILLVVCGVRVAAQPNMVPNGNFEEYTSCPTSVGGQITNCIGWNNINTGTTDYFNACHQSGNYGVPFNNPGYQPAASGNAYVGTFCWGANGMYDHEYIYRIITPLQAGATYTVSLSVSIASNRAVGINSTAVYFFKDGPTNYPTSPWVPVTPQVEWPGTIVADTQNWVRLSQTFVADSAYNQIIIGAFRTGNNVTTATISTPMPNTAYCYIDSVVVKSTDTLSFKPPAGPVCAGDTFSVPYTTWYAKNGSNVFTLQLSNASGSFSNPVTIGSTTSGTSGNIFCTIPANTPHGLGYKIRLLSTNTADTLTDLSPIIVSNPAKPSIQSNSPLCSGQTLQFYGTIGSGLSYSWSGPNSYTSSQQNPTLTNATTAMSGNYILTASIYGCSKADTETVVVHPSLQPITASVQSLICAGDTIKLAATNSNPTGANYGWTGPNSYTANTQNPTIPSAASGMNGDYIVTANLNGCTAKDTVTVAVLPKPAAVTIGSNSPLCTGNTLQLTSTASTTGATYAWAGPNSFTAGTQNSSISNSTTAATGWYKITVALNGCSIKDSTFATVNTTPAAPAASYSNPLCVGQTLSLSATNVTGASYSWMGIGGYTANAQNPTRANIQFGDTGMYNVTATVNGCTSPAGAVRVGINPSPFVVILANPGDSVCTGNPVVFTALPNNHGGTPLYQWYVNNSPVTTGALFNTTALANGDVVRCDMTEHTKCSIPYTDASNDITMNVLPWVAPSVTFTANPNRPLSENEFVTFTATSTNAGALPTYQWKRNGQNVQGATSSMWSANTLNDNDSISVEVISSYKCPQPLKGSANGVRVKILTGIGDVEKSNTIKVYPNPVKGTLRIISTTTIETITVNNLLGQQLMQQTAKGKTVEIDMSGLAAGVYVVKVNGVYTMRILKE